MCNHAIGLICEEYNDGLVYQSDAESNSWKFRCIETRFSHCCWCGARILWKQLDRLGDLKLGNRFKYDPLFNVYGRGLTIELVEMVSESPINGQWLAKFIETESKMIVETFDLGELVEK